MSGRDGVDFRLGVVAGPLWGHGPAGQRVKELEREVRELKRANEILRKASAFFAQAEFDRRPR